jgi:hypothetical protein
MDQRDGHLESLEPADADVIRRYYDRALELVPEAVPGRKYAMDCLTYRDRGLISVIRTRKGFSMFPFGSEPVALVREQLGGLSTSTGGVQFTADHLVPDDAFVAMVTWSRDHIDAVLRTR